MLHITHPRPQLGRQTAFGVVFTDGVAEVEALHPEREAALIQHGFVVAEIREGVMLEDLTVAELRDIADVEGIDLPVKAKKADIIAAIGAAPNIRVLE
ncbi:hypothetical protein [Microbacterium sp. KR10-403]|uniref:hypothetical protein n=1 Tax=Microbacterium sp. KR10-403 TaxID=3158581 RepID=UPI0032E4F35E